MKFWRNNLFLLLIAGAVMPSCDFIKMKDVSLQDKRNSEPVARVRDQHLYAEDLEGIAPAGMDKEDSTARVQRFINTWIRKQLLIQEAAKKIEFDEAEIERKMLDYRYSLMGYEYQSYYISKKLNVEVSDAEIEKYYQDNIDNFVLKQNIIRGKFIKIPKGAPKIEKVKSLLLSKDEEAHEELNAYSLSFATQYQLDDSVWMIFDEVIKNSPMAEIPNKMHFLKGQDFIELSDDQFLYFLKIVEYRISDNVSPLEFVKDGIKNIIINKRKVELAKQLEEEVYEKATKNKEFEIYN
ncbi:MAG: peptidylprolyl isomerase [Fulvivirga sp.]